MMEESIETHRLLFEIQYKLNINTIKKFEGYSL